MLLAIVPIKTPASPIVFANTIETTILTIDSIIGTYLSSKNTPAASLNVSYVLIASETDELRIKEDENSQVGWIPVDEIKH